MNDIKPPNKLPKPQPDAPIGMKDVRPVVVPPPVRKPVPEPVLDPSQPLHLPSTLPAGSPIGTPRKRRWLKWLLIIVSILIVLVAAAVTVGYFWYQEELTPYSTSSDQVRVVVEPGETPEQVADKLEQKDVIRSALALQIYMKLNGKSDIKAGSYLFTPNQDPVEILQWLNDGRVDTTKVTILPGQTIAQIKKTLEEKYEYAPADIEAAFAKTYSHPLLADKPAGTSLEGYIYPETYFVTSDITVEQLLIITFDELEKNITQKNLKPALAQKGFSLYQAITLGSIIEKEVANATDQKQVAQVFLKRLNDGMRLASDPTYKYAAALLGVPPSTEIDSPYNTYKHTGLPPGPIGNVKASSLEAVANPAAGDFLYFVAGDDGTTHYSRTFEEHEENIRLYCQKLCSSF